MRSDVLIVDDEPAIRQLLIRALDRSAISHCEAETALEALRIAAHQPGPLVALLDLGLPDRDGLEIVPQLTELGLAVLVLTARNATEEKVAALDLGADDFITKPFDSEELLARVRSALRRKAGPLAGGARRDFAGGFIDREAHAVSLRGNHVDLTPREFNLLWALTDRPGRIVTHESLLESVWGPAHKRDLDYLRVAIRALRRKMESDPANPRLIINEPGVGYRVAEA